MSFDPYSRTNQQILDGAVVGVSFSLACLFALGRISPAIVTVEFLLSLMGALGVRGLRRYIYEAESKKADAPQQEQERRVLLIGAGMMGATVARDMTKNPSIKIVGFLDDDPRKQGAVVAGAKVLGPTSMLTEITRTQKVDSVLVCIAPSARGSFNRLVALLDSLPVTSKFVPTITEILNSQDGLHLNVGNSKVQVNGNGNGAGLRSAVVEQRADIRNKTILITGGAGFIGSSLAERLAQNNEIILFDRFFHNQPITFTSLYNNPRVRKVEGDILDANALGSLAQQANIVVHAAAIVGVGRVCSYPRETLETNFVGALQVLKALEKNPRLERFVYFSTSEVFGVNSFRVHEDTPTAVGPAAEARWSYAIAKLAGEHLVKAYHRQAGMPVVTVRPFNVFGPRRLGAHAVQAFVLNSLRGIPIEVHGDGSQIRSWCYIEDFCNALLEMLARPRAIGEDFNIGNPKNTITIYELARMVLELTGREVPIVLTESPCPDIEIRVPSLEKAKQILDFQPVYDLRQGLKLTVDWYKENLDFFEKKLEQSFVVSANR